MKISKRYLASVTLLGLAVLVGFMKAANSQEPGGAKTSTFMRLKLEPAKALLEGIAQADFASIAKNAGTIRNLMLDEGWMVTQTEDYRRQSDEFRKVIEQLRDAANHQSLDGATLAYVQMTIRCVQCHQSLRK